MFSTFVILSVYILVCSSQTDTTNSPSSTLTDKTCSEGGLWTIWFEVNNTNETLADDPSSIYLPLQQIANDTCTTLIGAEIQLPISSRVKRQIQSSLVNSRNFRVRYCCEVDSIVSTTEAIPTTTPMSTDVPVTLIAPDGSICGKQEIAPRSSLTARIFGGMNAIAHSWPWMIFFLQRSSCNSSLCYIECGATLIDKDYVLTAAHCINTTNSSDITLIAGMHQQSSTTETNSRQAHRVEQIYIHPEYNSSTAVNDIALLRVDTSFVLTKYVQPACLPGPDPQPNDQVIIIGWGSERIGGNSLDTLRQAYTTVVGDCNNYWSMVEPAQQICVANAFSGDSACQGDSGGPMLTKYNGQYVLSGLTSYGYDCNTMGDGNYPNVYTRVSAYKEWIQHIIGH